MIYKIDRQKHTAPIFVRCHSVFIYPARHSFSNADETLYNILLITIFRFTSLTMLSETLYDIKRIGKLQLLDL